MKPKVKIYSYESWSSREYNDISTLKQDSPMDLSVKRPSPEHSIDSLHIHSDSDREHISRNLYNYRLPLYNSKRDGNSPNLLPYLLLHKNYDSVHQNTSSRGEHFNAYTNTDAYSSMRVESHDRRTLDTQYSDDNEDRNHSFRRERDYRRHAIINAIDVHQSLPENCEYLDFVSSKSVITGNGSQLYYNCGLKKTYSENALDKYSSQEVPFFITHKRWKSESDLLEANKHTANSESHFTTVDDSRQSPRLIPRRVNRAIPVPLMFERSVRLSDEEDMASDEFEPEDALDLRVCNSSPRLHHFQHQPNFDSDYLFQNIRALLSNNCENQKDAFPNLTSLNPWEAYKQYYYYLLHQPSIASRAAVAAAMADSYNKFMSSSASVLTQPPPVSLCDVSVHKYNLDQTLDGKAELRSADTTNGLDVNSDRKRISRPLTGRHVRHGTGASPSTLLSLRRMIQERQRLKQLGINNVQSKQKSRRNNKKK